MLLRVTSSNTTRAAARRVSSSRQGVRTRTSTKDTHSPLDQILFHYLYTHKHTHIHPTTQSRALSSSSFLPPTSTSTPWEVDLGNAPNGGRAILQLAGADAPKLVQGLITNDIIHLTSAKASLATGFLTNKGRLITESIITIANDAQEAPHGGPDKFFLDFPVEIKEGLLRHLRLFKLRAKVTIIDLTEKARVRVLVGSSNEGDFEAIKQERWAGNSIEVLGLGSDPRIILPSSSSSSPASPPHPMGIRAIVVPPPSSSNHQLQPPEAYETLRFLHGLAEGADLIEKLPSECNLDLTHAVNFHKGCYLGQELTARTQFKGVIRKRLLPFFYTDGSKNIQQQVGPLTSLLPSPDANPFAAPLLSTKTEISPPSPEKGANIIDENRGKAVGTITSLAKGSNLGLALLRLENVLGDGDAAVGPAAVRLTVAGSSTNEKYEITPFLPVWWPQDLDLKTGKVLA